MSTNEQRKQWAEHLADERQALQIQQRAAGETHSPTEGPLPHTVDQLDAAVAAAVAAERQRCAEIAAAWASESRLRHAFGDFTAEELRAAAAAASAVADEIRSAAGPRPQP